MTPGALMERPFLLVGLTGGIATGKSAVSEMFRALGTVIIDADVLARDFGPSVIAADGRLDRRKLAAIVFADGDRRRRLEAITHPRIRELFDRRLSDLAEQRFRGLVIFDAAVMIESGNYKNMDRLVVVVTDEATQIARLMARDGCTREDALARIRSQMPLSEKAKLADHVIDNSGSCDATGAQVLRLHAALTAELSQRVAR